MIYGYDSRAINEYGLKQMREISLMASADSLRSLARFLTDCADELETATSTHWHRHTSTSLQRELGCDVIVLNDQAQTGPPHSLNT
jgi:hypothetical protein